MVIQARTWLAGYDREALGADLVAGLTLAAYVLPAAIGDASLAGVPPETGLYACLFGGLVFWLFCSSRVTAVSVTSAISLLIGATLGTIDGGDPSRHATLAACTALLVALLGFAAYVFRAGTVVDFFSETVLVGFKAGVACVLASTQLPQLFGFRGGHRRFLGAIGHFVRGPARLPARRQPGIPGRRQREPGLGALRRVSHRRRRVAVAGQRDRGRAHADVRARIRGHDPRRRAVPHRAAAQPSAAGAGGD